MSQNDLNRLIRRFFAGKTDKMEDQQLKKLLRKDFDEMSDGIWESMQDEVLPQDQQARMRQDILAQVERYDEEQSQKKKFVHRKIWRAAFGTMAAAAVLAGAVFAGFQIAEHQTVGESYELLCANGQQSLLTLPDGTRVRLNSSSKLTYPSSFNRRNRNVVLEGEAFFDVSRNEKKPFVVTAGDMEVKVLGTQFNIKAYKEDEEIEATLVKGKIQASVDGREEILLPNERLSYDKRTGVMEKTDGLDPDSLVPWLENKVHFEHSTLAEIAVVLQRMYDIEVVFADKGIESFSYTGHIRNISLKNILELIASTSPIEYKVDGNKITFRLQD